MKVFFFMKSMKCQKNNCTNTKTEISQFMWVTFQFVPIKSLLKLTYNREQTFSKIKF